MDEKELRNLSPEERIRRLKELTEKDKQEIEEAQRLIQESELEVEAEMSKKFQLPIDQLKAVDMSQLVSEDERIIFREKRFVTAEKKPAVEEEAVTSSNLEEKVRENGKAPRGQTHAQRDYLKSLTANQIERRAEYLQHLSEERGYLSEERKDEVYKMNKEIEYRRDLANRGIYHGDSDINRVLDTAGNILRKLYNQ